jgi:hypothetical protein
VSLWELRATLPLDTTRRRMPPHPPSTTLYVRSKLFLSPAPVQRQPEHRSPGGGVSVAGYPAGQPVSSWPFPIQIFFLFGILFGFPSSGVYVQNIGWNNTEAMRPKT